MNDSTPLDDLAERLEREVFALRAENARLMACVQGYVARNTASYACGYMTPNEAELFRRMSTALSGANNGE